MALQVSDIWRAPPVVLTILCGSGDNDDFPGIILSATHRLNKSQVPHEMFGIQFVQVGTDPDASATLRALGDHLAKESKFRVCSTLIPRWLTHPYIAY
jgi:hypothetical protein